MISFAMIALGATQDDILEKSDFCTAKDLEKLLEATVPNFGTDCSYFASLFTEDGTYYHAHAGYFEGPADVVNACEGYASFCVNDGAECTFQVAGEVLTRKVDGNCHALVPYAWAEIPASE